MDLVALNCRTLIHNFANSIQPLLEKNAPVGRAHSSLWLPLYTALRVDWSGVGGAAGEAGVCVSSVTVISEPEDLQLPEAGREVTCIEASLPPGWHPIEPHAVFRGIMGFISARSAWLGPSLF